MLPVMFDENNNHSFSVFLTGKVGEIIVSSQRVRVSMSLQATGDAAVSRIDGSRVMVETAFLK